MHAELLFDFVCAFEKQHRDLNFNIFWRTFLCFAYFECFTFLFWFSKSISIYSL